MRSKVFYKVSLNLDFVEKNIKIPPKILSIKILKNESLSSFNLQFYLNTFFLFGFKKTNLTPVFFFYFLDFLVLFFFENRLEILKSTSIFKFPQKLLNSNLLKKLDLPPVKFKIDLPIKLSGLYFQNQNLTLMS